MEVHPTSVSVAPSVPVEIEAGTIVTVTIAAACDHGCDLRGCPVQVVGAGDVQASGELSRREDATWATEEIALTVPPLVGEQVWEVVFPLHQTESCVHQASVLPLRFTTVAHACSVAVWDLPSGVPPGRAFQAKIGVRCRRGCRLAEGAVEVRDEAGDRLVGATLGDTPWAGTEALFWTEMELTAPAADGVHTLTAAFRAADLPLPHEDATTSFTLRTESQRTHRTTFTVVNRSTGAPVARVEVRCGPYASSTDEDGVAEVMLPAGRFEASIRKDGFTAEPVSVAIPAPSLIPIEATPVPTRAELNARAFKDYPWG